MVGKLLSTILSALLIFALTGCGGGSEGTGSVEIRGAVTDSSGKPISEASILALTTGDSATSDANGNFDITAYQAGETFNVTTPAGTFTESTDQLVAQALYLFEVTDEGQLNIERGEEAITDPINDSKDNFNLNDNNQITTGGESKLNDHNQDRSEDEGTPTTLELNADVTFEANNGITVGNALYNGSSLESPVDFIITSKGQSIQLQKQNEGVFTAEILGNNFFLTVTYDGNEIASGRVSLNRKDRNAHLSFRIVVNSSSALVTAVETSKSISNCDLVLKESTSRRDENEESTLISETEAPKADISKDDIKANFPVDLIPVPDPNFDTPAAPQDNESTETESTGTEVTPVSEQSDTTESETSTDAPAPTQQPTDPKLGK